MKQNWNKSTIVFLMITSVIFCYLFIDANSKFQEKERMSYMAVEKQLSSLSTRTRIVLESWEFEDTTAVYDNANLLEELFDIASNVLRSHGFSSQGTFLLVYKDTVNEAIDDVKNGERTQDLKEQFQMINDDMSYLREQSVQDFDENWYELIDNLSNKRAVELAP